MVQRWLSPTAFAGDLGTEKGSLPGTPQSRASALGGAQGAGDRSALRGAHVNGNMTAWFDRLNQSFNSVGKVLHQDLSGTLITYAMFLQSC